MKLPYKLLAFCVAPLLPLQSLAADKTTLRLNLQPGQSWSFDQTQDGTSDNKASYNGQTQPYSMKVHGHRAGKAEVVAVAGGAPTSMRITFDDACETTMSMAGQPPQKLPFPYAGKTITVTRADDGTVTDDFNGQADPSCVAELHGMIEQEQAMFPKNPVAVGEEWPADAPGLARIFALQGPDDRAGMTLKLLSLKDVGGRPVAEVKVSMAVDKAQQGVTSEVISQGTALVDLQTGHSIKMDMKGTTTNSGDQSGPGPNGQPVTYHIEGKGSMTTMVTSDLIAPPAPGPVAVVPPVPGAAPAPAAAGSFAGKFTDGKLTVELAGSADSYGGTITLGTQTFKSTAHASGQKLEGAFDAGGNSFVFSATLDGDTLTFVSGGKTYTLKRPSTAANPLGGGGTPQPANPLGPGATNSGATNSGPTNSGASNPGAGQMPAGYSVVKSTDAGRSMAAHKPEAKTVTAALQSALPDLARYFDGRPTIAMAYEDVHDHRSGGASFTAKLKGQPVKGLVSCKLGDQGAAVAVIYCKSDASAVEWNKLLAPGQAGPQQVQLHEYRFPDGTGSIGLADGWTTKATSCNGMFVIDGPANQHVTMGFTVSAVTPTSTAVQMQNQLEANARQMGGQVPPLQLFVAPFAGPVETLKNLMPQVSAKSQQNRGPSLVMDHLKEVRKVQSILPGGSAALASYGLTTNTNGKKEHCLVLAQVEVDPISNDSFMFGLTGASAPDATFQQDLGTMLMMISSIRENPAVIGEQTRENIDAQNKRFAAEQAAHKELMAAYDEYNKGWERNQTIQSRSNADFDEVIRGYRTVEDTSTGYRSSVDLGNVNEIVDKLNEGDPGRYKQIPLRDEMYPLPGQGG